MFLRMSDLLRWLVCRSRARTRSRRRRGPVAARGRAAAGAGDHRARRRAAPPEAVPGLLALPDVDHPKALVGRPRRRGGADRRDGSASASAKRLVLLPARWDVLNELHMASASRPSRAAPYRLVERQAPAEVGHGGAAGTRAARGLADGDGAIRCRRRSTAAARRARPRRAGVRARSTSSSTRSGASRHPRRRASCCRSTSRSCARSLPRRPPSSQTGPGTRSRLARRLDRRRAVRAARSRRPPPRSRRRTRRSPRRSPSARSRSGAGRPTQTSCTRTSHAARPSGWRSSGWSSLEERLEAQLRLAARGRPGGGARPGRRASPARATAGTGDAGALPLGSPDRGARPVRRRSALASTTSSGSSPAASCASSSGGSCARTPELDRHARDRDRSTRSRSRRTRSSARDARARGSSAPSSRGARSRLLVLTGQEAAARRGSRSKPPGKRPTSFANGAMLVELAPLRDPELVVPTIAQRARRSPRSRARPLETVWQRASPTASCCSCSTTPSICSEPRTALARPRLARAPRLTVLVTSRAVLHVSGEHVFPVAPLAGG